MSNGVVRAGSNRSANAMITFILMVILFFTPLAGGTEQGISVWVVHSLILIVLLLWIFDNYIGRKRAGLVRTRLDYPILVFVLLSVLSLAFSVSPKKSFLTLLNFLDYIVLFYLMINKVKIRDRKQINLIMYTIIVSASLVSLLGIIKYLGSSSHILGLTYSNPNPFGAYLAMVIPVTLVMMMLVEDPGKKILIGYGACMMIVAFILTLSRGGWIALLCALFLMAYLHQKKSSGISGKALISVSFIIAVALLSILTLGYVNVKQEIAILNKRRIETVNGRVPIWKGTLKIIRAYPLLGSGPGTFPLVCEDYIQNLKDKYAHSEYLQTVAEWGVCSLPVILWIQALFFLTVFRVHDKARTRFSRYLMLGIIGSITAISIHSLAEFALHPMANAILCVVFGGIAVNYHQYDISR
ncbi:MAG: O-antigen ligase family protein [bacterium]